MSSNQQPIAMILIDPVTISCIEQLIKNREHLRCEKRYIDADAILNHLISEYKIVVGDNEDGSSSWKTLYEMDTARTLKSIRVKTNTGKRSVLYAKATQRVRITKKRFKAFSHFLSMTYPDAFSYHSQILDIAGGRGKLAWELCMNYNVPCTVVDPRPIRLSCNKTKEILRLCKNYYYEQVSDCIDVDSKPSIEWLHRNAHDMEDDSVLTGACHFLAMKGMCQIQDYFSNVFFQKYKEHSLKECKLIVGLHPDEATDAIVDVALERQIHFAVVPCCVFPDLFPRRRVLLQDDNGKVTSIPVRSLEHLCLYLQQKHPSIKMEQIPEIPGPCNIVVYR